MRGANFGKITAKWSKGILAGFLLAATFQLPAAAADPSGETTVRVAMYLDLGSTYRSTVPAVTFKANSALEAGPRSTEGLESWVKIAAGNSVRFSVSGYKVKAFESSDWALVSAAIKKLQGTTDKPLAYARDVAGTAKYEIFTGPYASAAEAQKGAARVGESLSGQLNGQKPSVYGNFFGSAGEFASQAEADALSQTLNGQGAEAFTVLVGAQRYAVWIGGAVSEAELSGMQNQLMQVHPGITLTPVQDTNTALILHRDVTSNLNSPTRVDHYEVYGSGAKMIISDTDDSVIQVLERSARHYRGNFEVSQINGQLALVNELPLEQYLYSVVGGEVPSSWPQESLKAQAVAARSYALYNAAGNKFKVAGLVDTTLSQVYNGADQEADSIVQAVNSTVGEVIISYGKIVEGIFSSNSGGTTADSSEVWNSQDPVFASVPSAEDKSAQAALKSWYHVLLPSGQTGYVREDNTASAGGMTGGGLKKITVTASSVMVRPLPLIQSDIEPVAKMNPGDQAVVLDKVSESGSYAWIRGPYSSEELLKSLKGKTATEVASPFVNLEVTQRGPSGRAIQVKADGNVLDVKYPDAFRSAFNGLPSTLFDIVSTGRYTVQGAGGIAGGTPSSGTPILSASGTKTWNGANMVVMGADGTARAIDHQNEFLFIGRGNGHGLGLSQWGAKGMADAGYDYRQILQHYYQNVTIAKE